IAACPIRRNRFDMPELLRYCNAHNIHLHFNTVWTPESESLRFLSAIELGEIVEHNLVESYVAKNKIQENNIANFNDFTAQIATWKAEAEANEQAQFVPAEWRLLFQQLQQVDGVDEEIQGILNIEAAFYLDGLSLEAAQLQLQALAQKLSATPFLRAYNNCLKLFAQHALDSGRAEEFIEKVDGFEAFSQGLVQKDEMAREIIRTGF